jgi:hypothetical protein
LENGRPAYLYAFPGNQNRFDLAAQRGKFSILSACPKYRPRSRKLIAQQQVPFNMAVISDRIVVGFGVCWAQSSKVEIQP